MARVLSSRPIHARNQWELEKARTVPRPSVERKQKIMRGCISGRGSSTPIFGVWTQQLN